MKMKMWFAHRLPRVARMIAVALFLTLVAALVVSYRNQYGFIYRAGERYPEYRLSNRLVSVTENVRILQSQGDRSLFELTASRDELYDDGHHELKDVALKVYGDDGAPRGWVHANNCVYDPTPGLVIFKNQVVATAWEKLSLKTERMVYDQNTGMIQTDQPVQFARTNLKGQVIGVEVRTRAGQEQVILKQQVNVTVEPENQSDSAPRTEPIQIRSNSAYYVKSESTIHLVGDVSLTQATEALGADRMTALFDRQNQLQKVKAEGRAVMQSRSDRRTSEVRAEVMEFSFDQKQRLQRAVASGDAAANVVEARQVRQVRAPQIEAEFAPSSSSTVTVSRIIGDHGRVEAHFSPAGSKSADEGKERSLLERSASEEKTLTADWVELSYRKEGRELDQALASGTAILVLVPGQISRGAERKTIRADQMEIEFYEDGNLAKAFTASGQVRVEFEPLEPNSGKQKRVTTSQKLVAQIDRVTQEFTQLTQSGDFHFTEGDREAKSEAAIYDADTHIISLRGGEPVIWDSRGRTRSQRVDINMETGESVAQGNANTTYYNQEATNRAAPFQKRQSPVFVAADRAEVRHGANLAIYTGNARAWQEDNYVSADRIELYGKERMMVAIGEVKSGFYRAPGGSKGTGSSQTVPVFAKAQRMTYLDSERLVRYESEAQLQQGSDRLSANRVTVFLKRDLNEIERAVAEEQVVVTEPGRRASGDQAVYTAADDRVVLIGQPARVEDDRYDVVQRGPRLTYLLGDDKVVVGDNSGSQRIRSVRKIQ
ncbi:MAG: LPS export ABC transporter periplasmic protein LptC [Acidobacteria bacterium]|nr:LPS export ABC transporter periplasmic protein LptC [Acidobacteriota bacterium]